MDIYGYPYHYGQSEELAKQMLAQQALAAGTPFPREVPEPHIMPVPPTSPWNSRGISWGLSSPPQVVEFTAQNPFKDDSKIGAVVHCKRKSLDIEPVIPPKQHITEEKMAAHLNSMHISSDYTSHKLASDELMDVWMDAPSTSMLCSEKLKGHTIVLSDEVKKIQEEPIIPQTIIERLEKPSMSLVVWKPRENVIQKLVVKDDKAKENDTELKKRNGVLVADDLGIVDVEM